MPNLNRVEVLIAGGGIGGLAAAVSLAARGRKVHVIEKEDAFGEIGAGIQLAPNASWALDRLGVLEEVHRSAVFPAQIVWMDALSGEPLTKLDLGEAFTRRYGFRYFVMHRSDLLAALLAAAQADANITLETSKDVVAVEAGDQSATVRCADGSAYGADLVVGADGLWSTVRKSVHDDGDPICSQYVAYRGTIPIESVSSHAGLDNVMLWTGPERHLVQYPVRRGELYNQVAVFRSHRYREDSHDWGTPDELDATFGACAPLVQDAMTRFGRNRRWPMFDRLPSNRWVNGRVVLMGDAAHPMLQYLAQGAAQALEDAVVLGDALAAGAEIEAGLAAYVGARAQRTAGVQTQGRRWGDYWHQFPGPGLRARDAYLRARAPDDFSECDWLYAYGMNYKSAAES